MLFSLLAALDKRDDGSAQNEPTRCAAPWWRSSLMQFKRVGFVWLPSRLLEDDWLISKWTRRLFFLSALCVLIFTAEFFLNIDTSRMSFWQRLPFGLTGLVEPFGTIFIWLGMWRYWVRLDNSVRWLKRTSFLLLLVGFWWGVSFTILRSMSLKWPA